jgi:hypothetical protein
VGLCMFLLLLTSAISGCSLGRVNQRMLYCEAEIRDHLPIGTPVGEAERFFDARGLKLTCCVSGPRGAPKFYFAKERQVGRFFFTEYDVVILVALSSSQRVESMRVERWGIGL